ncbi:tRNA (adenosine(37)-N6)-threonylcarbamoyltransferase complex dimerization subunit type 1 TsaB [Candidatus Babeliales bacterium]|nr:tRNA (adenosine(37)-N6)-threonylcarbamoyltransferase complex dimerization subunit type 1 TsaB [Candidatus Babeliales bacterium]
MNIPIFLSIQGSYNKLQISLFKGDICYKSITENNRLASSILIPLIKNLLNKNSIELSKIKFIGVDQGPGAFTSLRVIISTINGISFSSKIPLIGIDGLDALAQETITDRKSNQNKSQILIPLLNAYNNEVYYAFYKISENKKLELLKNLKNFKGYKKIDMLLEQIKINFPNQSLLFSGNGTELHKNLIQKKFENQKITIAKNDTCSSKQIAKMALEKYQKKEGLKYKLYPLYLKSQHFAIRSLPHTSNTS